MRSSAEPFRSNAVSRLALLAMLAAGLTGCSDDFSRFGENPWASKPPAQASNEVTGSVRPQGVLTHEVESH